MVAGRGVREDEGKEQLGSWDRRVHTAHLKWIINKDLLYNTGNSAQSYVAAWTGEEIGGRIGTCICMAESLCCSPGTITALLISYTPIQNKKFFLKGSYIFAQKQSECGRQLEKNTPCRMELGCPFCPQPKASAITFMVIEGFFFFCKFHYRIPFIYQ